MTTVLREATNQTPGSRWAEATVNRPSRTADMSRTCSQDRRESADLCPVCYALPTSMGELSIWLMIDQVCDMSSRRCSPREIVLTPGIPSCLHTRCPPSFAVSLAASSRVGGVRRLHGLVSEPEDLQCETGFLQLRHQTSQLDPFRSTVWRPARQARSRPLSRLTHAHGLLLLHRHMRREHGTTSWLSRSTAPSGRTCYSGLYAQERPWMWVMHRPCGPGFPRSLGKRTQDGPRRCPVGHRNQYLAVLLALGPGVRRQIAPISRR